MKQKITGLFLLAIVFATTTFATKINGNIDQKTISNFSKQFSDAKEVSWDKAAQYVKASFRMNDQYMFAFYSLSGELLGVTRHLVSTQLPVNLQVQLKKNYSDGWITELFEFTSDNETVYYTTIENANEMVTLKSTSNDAWTVYKKIAK